MRKARRPFIYRIFILIMGIKLGTEVKLAEEWIRFSQLVEDCYRFSQFHS